MHIAQIDISNYRNLDGLNILFQQDVNFIVGESNIGKSNLMDLIDIIINLSKFDERDFKDSTRPIEISLSLKLAPEEIGIFEDYFDPDDSAVVNLVISQNFDDPGITVTHKESGVAIASLVRKLTYVHYDSIRNPSNELNFARTKGVGKVLNYIVRNFMKDGGVTDTAFIERDKLETLIVHVNQHLSKIKAFKDFSISAVVEDSVENLLAQIVILTDENNFNVKDAGFGVQFLSLIPLFILERILSLSEKRRNASIISTEDGKKYLPLVLGLDEPEVHQYPYAQRALIKYLTKIMRNEDVDFNALLKDLFDLDGVKGQIIVVTHSPNIILNDYKQIIRLYKGNNSITQVKSGEEIDLDVSFHKHLQHNFMFVKEAFFSRCVIIVEGQTEVGAIHVFAERLGIDFDDNGISLISADGAKSIPTLMDLLDKFGVCNVAIMDNDVYSSSAEYVARKNLYHTKGDDFEEDIYDRFLFADYIRFLEEADDDQQSKLFFIKQAKKLSINIDVKSSPLFSVFENIAEDKINDLKAACKQDVLKFLRGDKNGIFAANVANYVTDIPERYKEIIIKALELS